MIRAKRENMDEFLAKIATLFSFWTPLNLEHCKCNRGIPTPQIDVVLLCFAVDDPNSFDSVQQYWFQVSSITLVYKELIARLWDTR